MINLAGKEKSEAAIGFCKEDGLGSTLVKSIIAKE